jgi:hypothetical protein
MRNILSIIQVAIIVTLLTILATWHIDDWKD